MFNNQHKNFSTLDQINMIKEQWQCNKKRYKQQLKKNKKRYYVARDEGRAIDDRSDEERSYQEVPVGSVAPATPTHKRCCREEGHAVERSHVSSPVVPAINRIVYDGLPDPKARSPARTVATPSPVHDRRATSLMQQLYGLQLNLERAKQRS
jgi:hypothetical protein